MKSFGGALASFEAAAADVGKTFHGGFYDTLNATARQASSLMNSFSGFCAKEMAEADAHAQALKALFPKGMDGLDEEMRNFERTIGWNERTGSFSPASRSVPPPTASSGAMAGGRGVAVPPARMPFSPATTPPSDRFAVLASARTPLSPTGGASPSSGRTLSTTHSSSSPSATMTTSRSPSPASPSSSIPVADAASKTLAEQYRRAWEEAYRTQLYPALQSLGATMAVRSQIGQKLDELASVVSELNRLSKVKFDSKSVGYKAREMDAFENQFLVHARLLDDLLKALPLNDSWMANAKSNLDMVGNALAPAELGIKTLPGWARERKKTVDVFRHRLAQVSNERKFFETRLRELHTRGTRLANSAASVKQKIAEALADEKQRRSRIATAQSRGIALCNEAKTAYCKFNRRTLLRFSFGQTGDHWTASPGKADFLRELASVEASLVRRLEVSARQICDLQKRVETLSPADLNATDAFPSCVIVDSCNVSIGGRTIELPIPTRFPFDKPRYFKTPAEISPFLLRLICALPVGSVQITMLDIEKKGDNGRVFNSLAKAGHGVFRLVTDIADLSGVLKEHGSYIASLASSGKFTATVGDWASYNARHPRNPLPFRILVVQSIHGWDERDVDDLADLFVRGPASGVHVFFSLDGMETLDERVRAKVETWPARAATSPVDLTAWAKSATVLHPTRVPMRFPPAAQVEKILDTYVDLLAKRVARATHVFKDLFEGFPVWSASSVAGLEAPVGWDEAGDPVNIRIGDDNPHALVGGKTGGGKTNLIHVILCSLCHRYSPEELQICLLDMKDGVEAFRYLDTSRRAWLPHAKAILASQSPHFASKYLEAMVDEMNRRNDTFKCDGAAKIGEWRKKSGKKMPRILFVADEFTHMFADSDLAKKASATLQSLLQLGRSCGIHVLLATQDTNALVTPNASVILSQTPLRFALPDAPGVLASGNHADRSIHKPQCILNESRGEDGMNHLFVHPFFDNETKTPGDVDLFRKAMETAKVRFGGASLPVCKVVDSMSLAPVPPFAVFQKTIGLASAGGRPSATLLLGREDNFAGDAFTLRLYGDAYRDHLLIAAESDPQGRDGVWNGLRKSIVWSLCCLADKQVLFYDPLREKPFKAPGFTVLGQDDGPDKVYENLVALRDSKARHRVLVIENFDQAGHVFFRENSYGAPDPDTAMGVLYSGFDPKKKAFTVILLVRDFTATTEILGDDGLKAMSHRIAFGYKQAGDLRPIIKGTDMLDNPGESIFYSGSGIRGGGYATILPFAEPAKRGGDR